MASMNCLSVCFFFFFFFFFFFSNDCQCSEAESLWLKGKKSVGIISQLFCLLSVNAVDMSMSELCVKHNCSY